MLKNIDLLKLISEPQRGEDGPASRYAVHIRPEIMQGYLAEAYARELARRGAVLENPEEVNAKIRAVSRWLTDGLKKPFLLLYGESPGTGKTTLARAIYRVITEDIPGLANRLKAVVRDERERIEKKRNQMIAGAIGPDLWKQRSAYNAQSRIFGGNYDNDRLKLEHPDLFRQVQEINERARKAIRPHDERLARLSVPPGDSVKFASSHDIVRYAERGGREGLDGFRAKILFLDDAGAEADSVNFMGNRIMPITEVILERYDCRAVTIITSNLSDEGLAGRYGARVADRLNEVADKIAFMGKSFRK